MPEYACGCVNEVHAPSGVLHCVRKCDRHRAMQRDPATLDARYYEELGVIADGKLRPTKHMEELREALGEFPRPRGNTVANEIGCGASPYVAAIRAAGWEYVGLDVSPWAVEWMKSHGDALCCADDWETMPFYSKVGLILCCHALEHMANAPAAMAKMAGALESGGELWVVVPDDSDPVNADHLWFFTEATLRSSIESAGLVVDRMAVRRYVKHESFLYARARKPA